MKHKIITNLPETLSQKLDDFVQKNGATRASVTKIALEKYLSEVQNGTINGK